jgi:hypothetical protein
MLTEQSAERIGKTGAAWLVDTNRILCSESAWRAWNYAFIGIQSHDPIVGGM